MTRDRRDAAFLNVAVHSVIYLHPRSTSMSLEVLLVKLTVQAVRPILARSMPLVQGALG